MPATTDSPRATHARATALARRYQQRGDRAARDQLIMMYAPMVRHIVFQKVRTLPSYCDAEDYIVCGLEALTVAADRFDPERGVTFEQYAWTRVHGAVMDELRREDWAPRSVRRFAREVQQQSARLSATGRAPSEDELADVLGISRGELDEGRQRVRAAQVLSLNASVRSDDGSGVVERQESLRSTDTDADPFQAASRQEALGRFRRAFAVLPEREREVAIKLYVANMTLREIGDELGVSESRVCQIHRQLRATLSRELRAHAELFESVV